MDHPGPTANRLPTFPASWYLFGAAAELRCGPAARDMLGRRVVAYRTATGRTVVLDARCTHLGADLGEGTVVGEGLQCAFHNWTYGPDGVCTHIPASLCIPAFARLRSYPVAERHGYVFFFNGPEPLFSLPFFAEGGEDDYAVGRPLRFSADAPWFLVNGNSFDAQHFLAAHRRRLIGAPQVDSPHPLARRIRMSFGVVGDTLRDRLLRRAVGDRVEVSIECWGGTVLVVTGSFRRTRSQMLSFIEPVNAVASIQNVLVHARRHRPRVIGWLLDAVQLGVRRWFTDGFLRGEFAELAGIRYCPDTLVASDAVMLGFLRWVAELPSGDAEWAQLVRHTANAGHDSDPVLKIRPGSESCPTADMQKLSFPY